MRNPPGLYANLGKIVEAEETYLQALNLRDEKLRTQPGNTSDFQRQCEIYQIFFRKSKSTKRLMK
jgi:hypothetical protein